MDNRIVKISKKAIKFGKDKIEKETYYLQPSEIGVRIEVSIFTRTNTAEFILISGDDIVILKKEHKRKVFADFKKEEIMRVVVDLITFAENDGII